LTAAKILIVDDSRAILAYASGILKGAGHSVLTTDNPLSVAALVRRERPDMILMDMQMPAVSGEDVVSTLKRFGCSDGVRVVFFSASVSVADLAIKTKVLGAHGYIHKASPLNPETLLSEVERLLSVPLRAPTRMGALVVDDSRAMRMLLAQILRAEGYQVTSAAHGREALERLQEETPSLALVDLEMPEMGGLELITAMRANPSTQKIPVLLVTSVKDEERIGEVLKAGASGYLNKPSRGRLDRATVVDSLRAMGI